MCARALSGSASYNNATVCVSQMHDLSKLSPAQVDDTLEVRVIDFAAACGSRPVSCSRAGLLKFEASAPKRWPTASLQTPEKHHCLRVSLFEGYCFMGFHRVSALRVGGLGHLRQDFGRGLEARCRACAWLSTSQEDALVAVVASLPL